MRKTVVYIACPMRQGHWTDNVIEALDIADDMMNKGYSVIIPILSWFWDMRHPHKFEDWIEMDYGLISISDAVFRIPGLSEGADLEMDYAAREGKNLYYDLSEFYAKESIFKYEEGEV